MSGEQQGENTTNTAKEQKELPWRWSQLFVRLSSSWILGALIFFEALGFNLYRLGSPSLWFDEVLSVERARQSLPVLWHIVFSTQQNMALYYVVRHFWLTFTAFLRLPAIESVVRFPSAVFAALGSKKRVLMMP